MKRICLILFAAVLLTACSSALPDKTESPIGIDEAVSIKQAELDASDAPFAVSGIYKGTSFDLNGDGTDDRVFGYAVYSQFEFVVFDGKTADILLDERVMMPLDITKLNTEVYSDNEGSSKIMICGKSGGLSGGLTAETVQVFSGDLSENIEAVYTEDDKFLYSPCCENEEKYSEKRKEMLNGYELCGTIDWDKYADGSISEAENRVNDALEIFGENYSDPLNFRLYLSDLDGDGNKELFIHTESQCGYTEVYDISEKAEKIGSFYGNFSNFPTEYKDKNGRTHFIVRVKSWVSSEDFYAAYCDVTYENGEISVDLPLCGVSKSWYDGGEFNNGWSLYSDCEMNCKGDPESVIITENAEFIGDYPLDEIDINDAENDSDEIKSAVQKLVFRDMDYSGYPAEYRAKWTIAESDAEQCKWNDESVNAFLGMLDDTPERYYNFADIDGDGLDEMLMADNYLWAVKPLSDTAFDKKLVSIDTLGGYASVAYGRPSVDAELYASDDYRAWYTPDLDIYSAGGRSYISGVHISAAAPYHIGWISEVKFDSQSSEYYLEPLYTWGYIADTALSFDGHIDSEHSADAAAFFADADIISGKKAGTDTSEIVHELARIYTDSIMEKLADSSAEDGFAPIASGTDTSVGTQGLNSVLYLADTESDGVPELFAGVSGTVGAGKYDFYSQDGTLFGTIICRAGLDCGKAVDGAVYIDSGRNSYPGWTKLTAGCPSIHITDFTDFDGADNDVDIVMPDGTEKTLAGLTFDEVKALYPEYLGVDHDMLADPSAGAEYNCLEGTLAVPDPDNYTEEDIYSCIEKLLNEYDEKFGID